MEHSKFLMDILAELTENAKQISAVDLERFAEFVLSGKRVYVAGVGRSGVAARAFSNRLMHLGLTAYFVGEPTTPAITAEDVLIIGSGSGETGSMVSIAQKARQIGARIATLTIRPEGTIGSLSEVAIAIPGSTPKGGNKEARQSMQPMANAFEQMSWLVYDTVIFILMGKLNKTSDEMFRLHANLE